MIPNITQIKRDNKTWMDNDNKLVCSISYNLGIKGYTKQDLANILGISLSTLYNKLNKPDSFTVREIRLMKRLFNISNEKVSEYI